MRIAIAIATAVIALSAVDRFFNHGRYSEAASRAAWQIAASYYR